jgi:hypothetical protein
LVTEEHTLTHSLEKKTHSGNQKMSDNCQNLSIAAKAQKTHKFIVSEARKIKEMCHLGQKGEDLFLKEKRG